MRKKLVLIICTLMLMSISTFAQTHYILEGGYALSANYATAIGMRQPMNGAKIGFAFDYRFKSFPAIGIKTGVGYRFVCYISTRNQFVAPDIQLTEDAQTQESILDHSIFLPIRMSVNFDIKDWTLKFLTGPKANYHFESSQFNYNDKTGHYEGKSNFDVVYMPFDCTWGVGFGTHYKHLYLETMIDFGLFNRTRQNNPTYELNTVSSREFYVTVGYAF